MKKLFVIDTNVVLFDHTCIYTFHEHDVALSVVVLEELDRFKRGNDLINLEARQFIRELDTLADSRSLSEGLPLGDGRGRLFLEVGEPASSKVSRAFALSKPDHRILALAEELRERRKDRDVILVSKDVNLRIKAKSLGLAAEDYTTGKVRNVERLYPGTACWEGLSGEVITRFHNEPHAVPLAEFKGREPLLPNQYLVMRNGSLSALAHHNRAAGTLERVTKRMAYGVEPRNAEQIFALDALLRPEIQLRDAGRPRRHRQDAAGARRRARAAPALPPDLPGAPDGAARQPRHRLPAGRRQEQARPLHAAALGQHRR